MPLPNWVARASRATLANAIDGCWSTAELAVQCDRAALALNQLRSARPSVGLLADNGPQWIAVDLATQATGAVLTPLPAFFSREQLDHAVRSARIEALFCADAAIASALGFGREVARAGRLPLFARDAAESGSAAALAHEELHKITFTSGTTGAPKGVCLSVEQQIATARALADATATLGIERHLNLLPLPVLLENVAGVYAPLMLGASAICPPLAEVGLGGASRFDAERCLNAIARHRAQSVILLPQMLHEITTHLREIPGGDERIRSLKFAAVGGGKVSRALIAQARALGLPVYEGYGLTECASVVALNLPHADRPGTVGRALPGTTVRANPDGELEVRGRGFLGYLGQPRAALPEWIETGDIGTIDAEGFITITGRSKNVIITSFGRNVSPEWPEGLLLECPLIAQAAVFGEAHAQLAAVLVPTGAHVPDKALHRAVEQINRRLPDYARIGVWLRAQAPFTTGNGMATANGRLRREAIRAYYARHLIPLYPTESIAQ